MRRWRCAKAGRWLATALLTGGMLHACRSAVQQREQLTSGSPVDQAAAAVWLAERGDTASVHRLVGLLESEDPSVRMYAILALRRLTGETYGYAWYDDADSRRDAVERWRDSLREGRVTARPAAQEEPAR